MKAEVSKKEEGTEADTKKGELPKHKEPLQLTAISSEPSEVDAAQELTKERQRVDECFKRLMYLQADFENYRKRVESETSQLKQFSNEKLVSNLLSVVDELELAIRSAKETEHNESLVRGVEMVLKKFQDILGKEGLSKINALDSPFDPKMHEVVSRVPAEGKPEGTIVEEVRSGYTLRGKVIRPSMVTIASSTTGSAIKKEGGVSA